jgi:dihydrofolate synthase / folylpolyglutamate synthase
MRFTHLSEWLNWIKSLHVKQIDLDLSRVSKVAERLGVLKPSYKIITVGGTNGKGSTVAGLETIYLEAGYKVGAFTSPFLIHYNEQIRILGVAVSDDEIKQAFEKIANARQNITLTPFEFTTLAALQIFKDANLDICILEVGLGGRLDAVNIMDADVSIVTSIDIDHAELLGDTREKIAHEKAGIFRSEKPAICGDYNPPVTLIEDAKKIGAQLYCQNVQFGFELDGFSWNWWSENNRLEKLPQPQLLLQNMSCVLMTVELLQTVLPVKRDAIDSAFRKVKLPARIQVIEGDVTQIYDVAHNPAAVTLLAKYLNEHPIQGRTNAVFSMLADKDITAVVALMEKPIDEWYVAPLNNERAATTDMLTQHFMEARNEDVLWFDSIVDAYRAACRHSKKGDRIVIFGSFHTVSEVLQATSSP